MKNDDGNAATLPGLETPKYPTGSLEKAVNEQVASLQSLGYIEPHHAAKVELALVTARDIDRSYGRGAPSGRANLLRVMNEILETIPQPEAASADKLAEVVAALRDSDDDEEVTYGDVRTGPQVHHAP